MSTSSESRFMEMFAHRADECTSVGTEHSKKVKILCNLLNTSLSRQKPDSSFDRIIVFCESDSSARRVVVSLVANEHQACIMTSDMFEQCQSAAEQERSKFTQGHQRVAICSVDAFKRANLPLIQHYVFFEIPKTKLVAYGNIISILDETSSREHSSIIVDTITSNMERVVSLKALIMEMESRRCKLPQWLSECDLSETKQPDVQIAAPRSKVVLTLPKPTHVPVEPPNSVSEVVQTESFDTSNVQPNRCIVPASCVAGLEDDEDDEPYEEEYNEHEYDYDNYDEYELDYDY